MSADDEVQLFWMEAISLNGETLALNDMTWEVIRELAPFMAQAGISVSHGDFGSDGAKRLLGGCVAVASDETSVLILNTQVRMH